MHAGADAVKFQTFRAEDVVSRYARKADYQARNTDERESQLEMVQKLELDLAAHDAAGPLQTARGSIHIDAV